MCVYMVYGDHSEGTKDWDCGVRIICVLYVGSFFLAGCRALRPSISYFVFRISYFIFRISYTIILLYYLLLSIHYDYNHLDDIMERILLL